MERYLFASDLRFNPRPTDGARSEKGRSFDSAREVAAADIYNNIMRVYMSRVCFIFDRRSTASFPYPFTSAPPKNFIALEQYTTLQSFSEILLGASSRNGFRRLNVSCLFFGYIHH